VHRDAGRQTLAPLDVRAAADVIIDIGLQIVGAVIGVPGQRRAAALVPEERDAAVGIEALQGRQKNAPVLRIDRGLIDVADKLRQNSGVELVVRCQ
jgi:hypothetical protein